MAMIVTVLRANDSTVTHADRAPNLMNAVAMAAAPRKGMNMGEPFEGWWGKEKAPQGLLQGRSERCIGILLNHSVYYKY